MLIELQCAVCDEKFMRKSWVKKGKACLCSRDCYRKYRKGLPLPKHGAANKCEACGKEFYVIASRVNSAKYCSRRCNGKVWAQKRRPPRRSERTCQICEQKFMGKKCQCYCSPKCRGKRYTQQWMPKEEATCETCGKKYTVGTWKPYKKRFCSQKCRTAATPFGASANGFKRGFKRRGWPVDRCQWCGYSEHPEILGFHHKDRNRKNNSLDNIP